MQSIIHGYINKNAISFYNSGGCESRCENTIRLFQKAFDLIKHKHVFTKTNFYINTLDISFPINNTLTFGYTQAKNIIPCPDFTFDRWIETGITKYETITDEIVKKGNENYSIDKLFWIGTLETQNLRYKLHDLGELYNDRLEIISMEWIKKHSKGHMHKHTQYVSLPDHTKYKYLIDCGAGGWSARMKFLLFTNRPLFLVERNKDKQDFFYDLLIPYKHYIPVWGDLSNLISQVEWAENNYNEARTIAKNAQEFALKYLSKEAAIMYLANQMIIQFTATSQESPNTTN